MFRSMRILCALMFLLLAVPQSAVQAGQPAAMPKVETAVVVPGLPSNCEQGILPDLFTGKESKILVCNPLPQNWNGAVVIFAHGYVFDNPMDPTPVLPYEQIISKDGWSLPGLLNALGFGFAMTSYSKNGLAVQEGVNDILNLVAYLKLQSPVPIQQIYLIGASEGGLITTLLIEKHPEIFNGGLAVCGPVGDFQQQVNYWGDFRVVYDALFPEVLPASAVMIPAPLMADWALPVGSTYQAKVIASISDLKADPWAQYKAKQLMQVTGAAIDLNATDPAKLAESVGATTLGILSYNILATNEAQIVLDVQPFDNNTRVYTGADTAELNTQINEGVIRYEKDWLTYQKLIPYNTTGELEVPLVTMHNTLDPIVPFWHQVLYGQKVLAMQSYRNYAAIHIPTYGHCNFTAGEQLYAFARMLYQANHAPVPSAPIKALLNTISAAEVLRFKALNDTFGDVSTLRVFLPGVSFE